MKNHNKKLSKIETTTTNIVNIGTIVSWIITLITATTLIAQPQPIEIPGVLELGKAYTLVFLVSILFGYLQVLKHFWYRSLSTKPTTESSFSSYLYASTIKFKRPFVLVGLALILIPIVQVELVGTSIVFLSILYFLIKEPEKLKWRFNDEFSKRWLKRVRNRLHNSGYTFTSDFDNLNVAEEEVNLAIETYFNRYEFEQNLMLTKHADVGAFYTSYALELRFDHLPSQLQKN